MNRKALLHGASRQAVNVGAHAVIRDFAIRANTPPTLKASRKQRRAK